MAPRRHWLSYDASQPLPTAQEALGEPFAAIPSWFLHIECERCGKVRMLNSAHASAAHLAMPLRDLLARARHDGCGGRAAKAELLTGVEGVFGGGRCAGSGCGAPAASWTRESLERTWIAAADDRMALSGLRRSWPSTAANISFSRNVSVRSCRSCASCCFCW